VDGTRPGYCPVAGILLAVLNLRVLLPQYLFVCVFVCLLVSYITCSGVFHSRPHTLSWPGARQLLSLSGDVSFYTKCVPSSKGYLWTSYDLFSCMYHFVINLT
jgi:hypothetical protein